MEFFLFKRPHHKKIEKILNLIDVDVLTKTNCYFGGGTAISLLLEEYRESVDIDFLCASIEGYSHLRRIVNENDFGILFKEKPILRRGIRSDRYGIRSSIDIDGTPIKIEFVSEGRIQVASDQTICGIPALSKTDMFAEKLLANADRWADRSVLSRDIIDLSMMIDAWGGIPADALEKTTRVYGDSIHLALAKATLLKEDSDYMNKCLLGMQMDISFAEQIRSSLGISLNNSQPEDSSDY